MTTLSFDLDDTLARLKEFEDAFWFGEMPRLYAKKHRMDFDNAKKYVIGEYDKVGPRKVEWYMPDYWISHFKLHSSVKEMLYSIKDKLILYPEVKGVLSRLAKRHDIIVITNCPFELAAPRLEIDNAISNIKQIFSTTSHFSSTSKSKEIYGKILNELNLKASEIFHAGNDFEQDYLNPKKIGIRAFYLDRKKEACGEDIIHSLLDLEKRL